MKKKNILVVCPGTIYPIEMGSQIRMYNLVKGLSKDHCVDVIAKVPGKRYLAGEYSGKIKNICKEYYPTLIILKNYLKKGIYVL